MITDKNGVELKVGQTVSCVICPDYDDDTNNVQIISIEEDRVLVRGEYSDVAGAVSAWRLTAIPRTWTEAEIIEAASHIEFIAQAHYSEVLVVEIEALMDKLNAPKP